MRCDTKLDYWLKNIQKLLYPAHCLLCGTPAGDDRDLCVECLDELPHNINSCLLCALPLTGHERGICGACLKRSPPVDGSIIPFHYAPPLDHLLLGLKFNRKLLHARLLGSLLAETIANAAEPLPDCILPVPLHPGRLRERGYNQSLELARPVSWELGVPLAPTIVRRALATVAQSTLEKEARRRNMKGAFVVQGEIPPHVAILDDVVTTGSTVNELARVLKRAGARRVVVWACARVP